MNEILDDINRYISDFLNGYQIDKQFHTNYKGVAFFPERFNYKTFHICVFPI